MSEEYYSIDDLNDHFDNGLREGREEILWQLREDKKTYEAQDNVQAAAIAGYLRKFLTNVS